MKIPDLKTAARLLLDFDNILILCHASPDGDTLGSGSALLRGLLSLGKRAACVCGDEIPKKYDYLFEGVPLFDGPYEHIVSVDVPDKKLLGALEGKYGDRVELAIDHHGTHKPFAENTYVEGECAANCEIIYLLLKEMGVGITAEIASCLYTGLATDTGCFRFANVSDRSHEIAAQLMRAGADVAELNRILFETKSRAQIEAERRVLEGLEYFADGRGALAKIPLSLKRETGAAEGELEGISGIARQIEGVVLGLTLKERDDGSIKASVRANPPADASVLCGRFGGGGHTGAAGCSFPGMSMDEAEAALLSESERYLKELFP